MIEQNHPVAVVTGAGSGIGRVSARALEAAGFRVVLAGRREAPLAETAAAARTKSGGFAIIPADVADAASVKDLFAQTQNKFGRIDVLFNNAGVFPPPAEIDQLSVEDWDNAVAVNLRGMFLCAREAYRLMKQQNPQGGRIINNGSISAHAPRPLAAPYTVTKHAITGLTKQIALDGRAHNIACSQIDIGNAVTELSARMASGTLQADGRIAVEPRMDVAHVAEAVLYIAKLPLSANVPFMTLMASGMPYIGRG